MRTADADTDLSKALDTFYVLCPFTRLNHQGDILTYKVGAGEYSSAYSLDEAERIIRDNNLPLKAELNKLIQSPYNILTISAK